MGIFERIEKFLAREPEKPPAGKGEAKEEKEDAGLNGQSSLKERVYAVYVEAVKQKSQESAGRALEIKFTDAEKESLVKKAGTKDWEELERLYNEKIREKSGT